MSSRSPNLNIHVTYKSHTYISTAPRKEFLRTVCKKYNLNENEIEIFDIKNKKFISIDELKDFAKVEIKKKAPHALNGRSHSPGPSTSKYPDKKELAQKLLDNRVLTGKERAFLIETIEFFDCGLKRKRNDSDGPVMKSRKVQVDATILNLNRTTSTQTEKLIDYNPSIDTTAAANVLDLQSKRLAVSDKIDMAVANDLMSKSYDKRRHFILLERPLVKFVKEKYPLLFSIAEVRNELDRIFYQGKCAEFIANIEKYSSHILSIARDDDPLLLTTQNKINSFQTAAQKKYAQDIGALLMCSSLVFEDRDFLLLTDKNSQPGDFPYIVCQAKLHDLYFDQHIFSIFVERTMLCEASDFKEAILCLIASYFIFNISYPDTNFSTFAIFEKLFLEANDTDDSDVDDAVRQIIRSIQLKWQAKSR